MLPGLGDILPESRNLVFTTQALPQTLLEEGTCLSGHTCVSACCPECCLMQEGCRIFA